MTLAFVLVECARGLASSAEQAIKQLQGVVEAHAIKSGTDYDLIVKVTSRRRRSIQNHYFEPKESRWVWRQLRLALFMAAHCT